MSSWAEERFEHRATEDEHDGLYPGCRCRTCRLGLVYVPRPPKASQDEPESGEWVCHLCADGGLTPWPPGTECPNYPCKAFQRPRD
jgi:hypothetical protein